MKLNDSTLRSKLKTYLQSDKFQKQYAEQVQPKNVKWYWEESDIENIVNKLKRQIWLAAELLTQREYNNSSSLAGMDYKELLSHRIVDVVRDPSNNRWITSCRVELFFNPIWVQVASLYPEKYPNGVDNIIRLLTNGWDNRRRRDRNPNGITNLYRGRMHGDWHLGSPNSENIIHNVYAVTYRRGSSILFDYIDAFNREINSDSGDARGVFATLSQSYVGAYGIGGLNRMAKNKTGNSIIDSAYISGIGIIRFGLKK